ncbi:MAG TPA: zinc ribbon domain-containing protein [Terriglobales bacterium]|nr:zinc ribbon domain-containing protein [Terriglobales bacterium]
MDVPNKFCPTCGSTLAPELQPEVDGAIDLYHATCANCQTTAQLVFQKFSKVWQVKSLTPVPQTHAVVVPFTKLSLPVGLGIVSARAESSYFVLEVTGDVAEDAAFTLTLVPETDHA